MYSFCLVIDEIGYYAFDKENTRLFFDLIDRRYNKLRGESFRGKKLETVSLRPGKILAVEPVVAKE